MYAPCTKCKGMSRDETFVTCDSAPEVKSLHIIKLEYQCERVCVCLHICVNKKEWLLFCSKNHTSLLWTRVQHNQEQMWCPTHIRMNPSAEEHTCTLRHKYLSKCRQNPEILQKLTPPSLLGKMMTSSPGPGMLQLNPPQPFSTSFHVSGCDHFKTASEGTTKQDTERHNYHFQ